MSDIKEVIGKVNGMPVLKENTIVALQKDIRDLKNLMRTIEGRMQDKKVEIKEKDLPPVVSVAEEVEEKTIPVVEEVAPKTLVKEEPVAPKVENEIQEPVVPEKTATEEVAMPKVAQPAEKSAEPVRKNVFVPNDNRQNRNNK
ncbi:MAG: hypothetical protein K2L47_02310, partial [Clostridia bacterium]|nr:hypothetical protein [Clostridia bacterium]